MAIKPTVIAEVGCNHCGSMDLAKRLIRMGHDFCNVDYVKFQKRCNRELLTAEQYNAPHPNPDNSYGETYGLHREALEFTHDQHRELAEYCDELGVGYASSVWDMQSAADIVSVWYRSPSTRHPIIKVPSACNLHYEMLSTLCSNFSGHIHLSLGMTRSTEEDEIVKFFQNRARAKDLVLYACTSGYPVPAKDVCLREITRLKEKFDGIVYGIGFSGHHLGIALDVAAYTLGAEYIERHFTLDRTWKGTDHAASLEPDGMRKLVRDLSAAADALTLKSKQILDIEEPQLQKLKWRPH